MNAVISIEHSPPPASVLQLIIKRRTTLIACFSAAAIIAHLFQKYYLVTDTFISNMPLLIALVVGGLPLIYELILKALRKEFGSDLLAGIAIITSLLLDEYLAGTIVVFMLSGGEALESYALLSASSVLRALAGRLPANAHLRKDGQMVDIPIQNIQIGDQLAIFPHETCPVDGVVSEGYGGMDEAYLTGEPFKVTKTVGSNVISGAINGDATLIITASSRSEDSRFAKIMQVMKDSEQSRPQLRRLGDQLGAYYTPLALTISLLAWWLSADSSRFLSVLVIATPCPLLIAIPVAIIGSISLCARRAIIVKSPIVLEQIGACRTAIFDKTGTLTYGMPALIEILVSSGASSERVLQMAASLEQYSKHPLAEAILEKAKALHLPLLPASQVHEPPGQGLKGVIDNQEVMITSRRKAIAEQVAGLENMSDQAIGLECVVIIAGVYSGTFRFRDAPRAESEHFVKHLKPRHAFNKLIILSGDRKSEVEYLAREVGISDVLAEQSPEQKLAIVRQETKQAKTLYVGDGINDAPAMMAATVGVALGKNSDVTLEAAGVVVLDNSLQKVDEFIHISQRMRNIALQSAVGGMALSVTGMALAAFGYLTPVQGAIGQELIDIVAVLNALRAAWPPKVTHDF